MATTAMVRRRAANGTRRSVSSPSLRCARPTIPTADDNEEVEESDVVTGGAVGNGYGEHTSLDATLDSGAYEDFIDTHHHAAAPSAADLASSSRPTTSFAESWARDHQLPEEVPPVLATLATLAACARHVLGE